MEASPLPPYLIAKRCLPRRELKAVYCIDSQLPKPTIYATYVVVPNNINVSTMKHCLEMEGSLSGCFPCGPYPLIEARLLSKCLVLFVRTITRLSM